MSSDHLLFQLLQIFSQPVVLLRSIKVHTWQEQHEAENVRRCIWVRKVLRQKTLLNVASLPNCHVSIVFLVSVDILHYHAYVTIPTVRQVCHGRASVFGHTWCLLAVWRFTSPNGITPSRGHAVKSKPLDASADNRDTHGFIIWRRTWISLLMTAGHCQWLWRALRPYASQGIHWLTDWLLLHTVHECDRQTELLWHIV